MVEITYAGKRLLENSDVTIQNAYAKRMIIDNAELFFYGSHFIENQFPAS